MMGMRHAIALALAVGMAASPGWTQAADDAPAPEAESGTQDGLSLIEDGARLILRGLRQEMEPAVRDFRDLAEEVTPELRRWAEEMGPALRDLAGRIGDLNDYHAPEMLPNGDIILRRKVPLAPDTPDVPDMDPGGEIEL
jgi:hypothetical protein